MIRISCSSLMVTLAFYSHSKWKNKHNIVFFFLEWKFLFLVSKKKIMNNNLNT